MITGITGQDGAYLAELLLNKGYIVHGIKQRTSLFNTDRIDHLYKDRHEKNVRFFLHHGDLTDSSSLIRIIQQTQPMLSHINVGYGGDITIRDLAETISKVVGYQGEITFDPSKPDGTPRKLMDRAALTRLAGKRKFAWKLD